jgi:hypothetical protein
VNRFAGILKSKYRGGLLGVGSADNPATHQIVVFFHAGQRADQRVLLIKILKNRWREVRRRAGAIELKIAILNSFHCRKLD